MDRIIFLSEGHRSGMLLDVCGACRDSSVDLAISTVLQKPLVIQYTRNHPNESRRRADRDKVNRDCVAFSCGMLVVFED